MLFRRCCLLLLTAVLGTACASGDSAYRGGGDNWGQTGSLTPECRLAPLSDRGVPVPEGDSATIVYTSACTGSLTGISLTDSAGQPIDFKLELLDSDNGAYLVRTETPLQSGEYQISLPGSSTEPVSVSEAAPLPMTLGTLTQTSASSSCGFIPFALELDEAALPYAPLMALMARIDGGLAKTWIHFGRLELVGRRADLSLSPCFDGCLTIGTHQLAVTAIIAGEQVQPASIETTFDMQCQDTVAEQTEQSCAVQVPVPGDSPSPNPVNLLYFILLAFVLRSIRRSARD